MKNLTAPLNQLLLDKFLLKKNIEEEIEKLEREKNKLSNEREEQSRTINDILRKISYVKCENDSGHNFKHVSYSDETSRNECTICGMRKGFWDEVLGRMWLEDHGVKV